VEGTKYEGLKDYLTGPTTLALSYGEPTTAARVINKEIKNAPKLAFKAGVIDGVTYDSAGMGQIADIAPREELLARLLGSFKSPIASFARVINEIAKSKGGGEPAVTVPAEAAAE
jgi:large subunit ribosomal protein L10